MAGSARTLLLVTTALIAATTTAAGTPNRIDDAVERFRSEKRSGWISWSAPIVDPSFELCCSFGRGEPVLCPLDGNAWNVSMDETLENGSTALIVFARFEHGELSQLRTFTDPCRIDVTGQLVVDLGAISAADSVGWLESRLERAGRLAECALTSIALHEGVDAELAVERVATSSASRRLRRDAVFWLGRTGGRRGLDFVKRLVWNDSDERLLESAVFGLSQSPESGAADELVMIARRHPRPAVRGKALFWLAQNQAGAGVISLIRDAAIGDPDPDVRKQAVFAASRLDDAASTGLLVELATGKVESDVRRDAIFWLSQKAGKAIGSTLRDLVDDPDAEIRERAVFAISQRPDDESIPILADLARHHSSPGVRKKALFWLGQKDDPRVVKVFEEILGTSR